MPPLRLGVNIDHVATLRNARGGTHPDPLRAALLAREAGADGVTAHLREDRRHMLDADMFALREGCDLPLNFEMAATEAMIAIALRVQPHAVCLVPEKREERTTEGGLDVAAQAERLKPLIQRLSEAGIRVSLFVAPEMRQIEAAKAVGAPVIELHTGAYCDAPATARATFLQALRDAALHAELLGLECHAGHGLDYDSVSAVAGIAEIRELNIGHFLIGEAVFTGLVPAIARMRELMQAARAG
jgi:pyridoxine 5-phosphate synthase